MKRIAVAVMSACLAASSFAAESATQCGAAYNVGANIELRVQRSAMEALVRSVGKDDTAWCVVVRVKDGVPVAFAECGDTGREKLPLAVNRLVEPGHTISPLTAAIAIESGIASSNTMISAVVDEGLFKAFRLPVDPHRTNELSLAEAIATSSNTAISRLGIITGADKLYEGYARFGFGARLRPFPKWTPQERARIPQGQGLRVSALEIANAYAILARHGTTASGERVISKSAAEEVIGILEYAVANGIGKRAAIDGVHVAGKTGTTTALKDGRYDHGRYVGSFAGFFPVETPQYVIVVMCEARRDPDAPTMHQGGGKAAAAFKAISEGILQKNGWIL